MSRLRHTARARGARPAATGGRVRRLAAAVALLLVAATAAPAQQLARLFPLEADVYTTRPGLARLPLPPAVLAGAGVGLADLRLFDRDGNEVPYLVDPGTPAGRERRERSVAEPRVTDLEREEIPREDGKSFTREVYTLALPEPPPAGEAWTLVVSSARPRYVRSVEVGTTRDEGYLPLVARASLVRLGQPLVDRSRIPLPLVLGGELVVAIEGEEGFFLEPTFRLESEHAIDEAGTLALSLEILERRREPERTVVEVERSPGLVTSRLRFATATPLLDRAVSVLDVARNGRAAPIGGGRLVRAPGAGDGAASLDVVVAPARGDRLRVTIDDADSPPLEDLAISALVSQPAILFVLPAAPEGRPAGLVRFGGGRAWRPRYDIAALLSRAGAAGMASLADPAALPRAVLGPPRPNPLFDPRPALAPLMHPGPEVEVDAWRWRRPLVVPESPEGLARVRLEPEDLARAQADRADLRVVDAQARQWPYVVAPAVTRAALPLRVAGLERDAGTSRWRLELPATPLAVDRLVVTPTRPVLHRPYRVVTRDADGEERMLARGALAQDLRRPQPVEIALGGAGLERLETLELLIEDGDDAPVEIARIEARLALPELLVAAPAGDYALLAGNPDAAAPDYEIARVRGVVLGVRSVPALAGEGAENPRWTGTPGGSARLRERLTQLAVWTAIVLAVLVLGVLTLRIVRGTVQRSD